MTKKKLYVWQNSILYKKLISVDSATEGALTIQLDDIIDDLVFCTWWSVECQTNNTVTLQVTL